MNKKIFATSLTAVAAVVGALVVGLHSQQAVANQPSGAPQAIPVSVATVGPIRKGELVQAGDLVLQQLIERLLNGLLHLARAQHTERPLGPLD